MQGQRHADRHNDASSSGTAILVNAAPEQLLSNEDALAFVSAHDAVHIILGHSRPDQRAAAKTHDTRVATEQAADGLGLRLMQRAGYASESAADATTKSAHAGRGPIWPQRSARFSLHGKPFKQGAKQVGLDSVGGLQRLRRVERGPATRRFVVKRRSPFGVGSRPQSETGAAGED